MNTENMKEILGKAFPVLEKEIQQTAVRLYRSGSPTEKASLIDALIIISHLKPFDEKNTNTETIGITASIYKRLWLLDKSETEFLTRATNLYKRGYELSKDYWCGENYALCLYLANEPNKAKAFLLDLVNYLKKLEANGFGDRIDVRWIYATMANCSMAVGHDEDHENYEKLFFDQLPTQEEIDTYIKSKEIFQLL